MPPPILLTIPASHFCEKARWALERAGVPVVEEGHAPFFSRFAGWRRGVWHTVPTLFTDDGPIPDSTAIIRWVDARVPASERLLPGDPEVERWENLFDARLGPHARRLAYAAVLPRRALALRLLRGAIPRGEIWFAGITFPLMRALMRRGMRIDEAGIARSRAHVDEVFAEVGERLRDRRFLVGERFTAADLAFAALAAPLVLPPQYGGPLPTIEELPDEARALVERLRETLAGQYVLRLYAAERGRRLGAPAAARAVDGGG